jgi:hypothetical protein
MFTNKKIGLFLQPDEALLDENSNFNLSTVYVGRCPTPHKPLKRLDRNFLQHWFDQALRHFGTGKRSAFFRQRKAYFADKESSLSFRRRSFCASSAVF